MCSLHYFYSGVLINTKLNVTAKCWEWGKETRALLFLGTNSKIWQNISKTFKLIQNEVELKLFIHWQVNDWCEYVKARYEERDLSLEKTRLLKASYEIEVKEVLEKLIMWKDMGDSEVRTGDRRETVRKCWAQKSWKCEIWHNWSELSRINWFK